MKCDVCKENEATIHIQEVVNNNIKSIHLCEKCAQEYGIKNSLIELGFSLIDFFDNFKDDKLKFEKNDKDGNNDEPVCRVCGMPFSEFIDSGKFGCGNCYEEFKDFIKPLLRKIHGSSLYKGEKFPEKIKEKFLRKMELNKKLLEMKNKLKIALKEENYKEAAILRDKIKKLKFLSGDL